MAYLKASSQVILRVSPLPPYKKARIESSLIKMPLEMHFQ